MIERRICTNGEESDVHSRWRHRGLNVRPGVTKQAKRRTNRRERREGQAALREFGGGR